MHQDLNLLVPGRDLLRVERLRGRAPILRFMDAGMVLDIATTSAVVFGVVFGVAQVRHAVRDRRDHAAVDIVRTVQTQEVRRAVERVLRLPEDADPEVVRSGTWTRLQGWVEAEREEKRSPNIGEWWQWLYERLEADPDLGKLQGAHIAYRGRRRR